MDNKLDNFLDNILIISLPGDEHLFQQTESDLVKHGFSPSKIVKIPGVKYNDRRVEDMFEEGRVHINNPHLTPHRIGNWLAHYDAWEYIRTYNLKAAMICEDDIFILDERWKKINKYTRKIYQITRKNTDFLVRLSVTPHKTKKMGVYSDREVRGSLCSNPCYIINGKFATKLIKGAQKKISVTSDAYIHNIQAKHIRTAYSFLPPIWKDKTWYTQEIESRVRPQTKSRCYEKNDLDLSLVVGSTDSYSWLWKGFLYFFKKEWDQECNIEKYFLSETKSMTDCDFENIRSSKGYTDALSLILGKIKTDYILWMQDDYWLTSSITKDFLMYILINMEAHGIDKVALHNFTKTQSYIFSDTVGEHGDIVRIHPQSDYLIDVQVTIWRAGFLRKCLPNTGCETPWQFEKKATERARNMKPDPKIYIKNIELTPKGGVVRKGEKTKQYYQMAKEIEEGENE